MADPGYLDLFISQGSTYNTNITLTDVNNAPVNVANLTVFGTIKHSYITSNVAANFTVTSINIAGGVIQLSLNRQTTANLTPKRYVYDVILYNPGDDSVNRILEGTIYLTPGVSILP